MLDQVWRMICNGVPLQPSVVLEQSMSSIAERHECGGFEEGLHLWRRGDWQLAPSPVVIHLL
jgi:hypothetical protein